MKRILLCLSVLMGLFTSCVEENDIIEYVDAEVAAVEETIVDDGEEESFVIIDKVVNGGQIVVPEDEQVLFNISDDVSDYYEGVLFSEIPDTSLEILEWLMESSQTNILGYTDRHDYLYDADADLTNSDNVILIYSGESYSEVEYAGNPNNNSGYFNTEHVYPQSFLPGVDQEHPSARDLHLLRACQAGINTSRSNSPFVEGTGDYGYVGDGWYPGDEWIGDVARIVMYVHMYYDEPFEDVGDLDLFLEWNAADPVSEFEIQRNDVIEGAQGNRNPFIDNPYLATLIWGGDAAENTWE